jgi:hypothetical protein
MSTYRIPVDLEWSGASGSPGVNTWHGRDATGSGGGDSLDSLASILETFYTTIAALIPTTATMKFAGIASGVGDDAGDFYSAPEWTVTGTGTGSYLPPANAMLVSWRALTGGRSGRGRTFLSPLTEGLNEANGTPDETARDIVQAAIDNLIEDVDTAGNGALGIYSRTDSLLRDFVSGTCPNYFASIRSRRD